MIKVVFTNTGAGIEKYQPQPASKVIPEWYKNTESYFSGKKEPSGKGQTTATVKRCMPVFDAITGGYIIFSHTDVFVSPGEDGHPWYQWPQDEIITFHPQEQANNHPVSNGSPYPKWNNPWAIKTPAGYSCLFIQPVHRDAPFTILPGIVDTDSYIAPVNFPFVINDTAWTGTIPAGTPIAQVIPFKRDVFEMKIGKQKELEQTSKVLHLLRSKFFDSYKTQFWHRKEYK